LGSPSPFPLPSRERVSFSSPLEGEDQGEGEIRHPHPFPLPSRERVKGPSRERVFFSPLPWRERIKVRGKLGTLTLSLSRQGRGLKARRGRGYFFLLSPGGRGLR